MTETETRFEPIEGIVWCEKHQSAHNAPHVWPTCKDAHRPVYREVEAPIPT